jgi:hypothetical protein
MIKVADIYVPEDGCGPYALSICGGVDAAYFKVIGKELYFDEDKFKNTPVVTTTTTTQTTTIDPNRIQIILSGPYDDIQYCVGRATSNFYVEVGAIIGNEYISNPQQVSYQWQESLNKSSPILSVNAIWNDIPGQTSSSLRNYTKASFSNYVRVKVTYQGKTVISRAARGYCVMV